ncbi:MAG: alanine racemase [Deinococcales bacterium]
MSDTHAQIDLGAIVNNARTLSEFATRPVLAPIKADAYGHGAVRVAQALESQNFIYGFAVATAHEALELRRAALVKDVVLLTPPPPEALPVLVHHQISFVVSSLGELNAIASEAAAQTERPKIHLKINTGLNRLGASFTDGEQILKASLHSSVELYGIMTHLVDSEDIPAVHAATQVQRFRDFLEQHKPDVAFRHLANTGAVLNKALHAEFDLVRPGIGLYGYAPGADCEGIVPLKPAMTLLARVLMLKTLVAGEAVSYNATWRAPRDTQVATLRLGYADGYPRAVSSKAQMLLRGQKVAQIGRVCMDQLLLDVRELEAEVGELVTVFGADAITAEDVAIWAQTNSYEILTGIGARVPRHYAI